ncbi:hypothetical protein D3C78_523180 [compost metagenome]
MHAAHHEFIVQVRACDAARAPQQAYGLPLFHPLALVHCALGEVQVLGHVVAGVLDEDIVAVELVVTGGHHAAATRRHDGGAHGGHVVDAVVGAHLAGDRVQATRIEVGADVFEVDRGAQEALAHRLAFRGVVVAILVQHGAIDGPLVDELGGQDVAGGHPLVILVLVFVDHPEAVSRLQVLGKVDVPAEDGGQVHDLILRHARLAGGAPEAGSDLPLRHLLAGVELEAHRSGHEAVVLAAHLERLLQAVGVIEAVQLALFGELEGELLSRLQHAQGIAAVELIDKMKIRGIEPDALEDDPHVVAPAHLHLLGDVARLGRGERLSGLEFIVCGGRVGGLAQGKLVAVVIDPGGDGLFAWPGCQHHHQYAQNKHHLAVPGRKRVEGVPNDHEKLTKLNPEEGRSLPPFQLACHSSNMSGPVES